MHTNFVFKKTWLLSVGIYLLLLQCFLFTQNLRADKFTNLLIDETTSFAGHEFFRIFTETLAMDESLRFSSIIVKELPVARSGTSIQIEYEYSNLFETSIYSGSRYITQGATRAAMVTRSKIRWLQRQKTPLVDPDLAENEI